MQGSRTRLKLIDFLRGVAILEMCITHFSIYFSPLASKIITFTETAMALFVLLAGFMVGWEIHQYSLAPRQQAVVLWKRALRIAVVQCIIVITLGLPLHLIGMPGVGTGESLLVFLARSLTLQNQIGLIHILPTFIPLFAISPLLLWALARQMDWAVLFLSAAIFSVGHFRPYVLDFGDPTIFPFVLYQLYFVIGCVLGKRARDAGTLELPHPGRWLAVSAALLAVSMLTVHGKIVPRGLVSIHPLNAFGLAYQLPILATLCLGAMAYLPALQRTLGYGLITRFGRHALLAFVIHVYLAKIIGVANYFADIPAPVNYVLVFASIVTMDWLLRAYETRRAEAVPPTWVRVLGALFR